MIRHPPPLARRGGPTKKRSYGGSNLKDNEQSAEKSRAKGLLAVDDDTVIAQPE